MNFLQVNSENLWHLSVILDGYVYPHIEEEKCLVHVEWLLYKDIPLEKLVMPDTVHHFGDGNPFTDPNVPVVFLRSFFSVAYSVIVWPNPGLQSARCCIVCRDHKSYHDIFSCNPDDVMIRVEYLCIQEMKNLVGEHIAQSFRYDRNIGY